MSSNDCEIFHPLWQYSLDSEVWAASGQAYFWGKNIRKIKTDYFYIWLIKLIKNFIPCFKNNNKPTNV